MLTRPEAGSVKRMLTSLAQETRDNRIRVLEDALARQKVMLSEALDREAALKARLDELEGHEDG